jgi:hypothetical protein
MMSRSPKRAPRTRPDKPITADVLRELLEEKAVLKRDLKMPSSEALEELARTLERWRLGLNNDEIQRRRAKLQKKATRELATAKDTISQLHQLGHMSFVPEIRDIERVRRSPGIWNATCYTGKSAAWSVLASVLPKDFAIAVKSTNPTFKLGISGEGPTPRFVAAVAPLITGEHPTVASAAGIMKKARKAHGQDR